MELRINQARKIPPFKVEYELLVNVLCLKSYKMSIYFAKNLLKLRTTAPKNLTIITI